MSDFKIKVDDGKFELHFSTDDPELFNLILNVARWCVDKEEKNEQKEK